MKKIFIWERVDGATGNWHTEGGVVVIAESLETARDYLRGIVQDNCEALTVEPDATFDLANDDVEPESFIFPDSGCC